MFQDGVRINEPFGDGVNWDLIPNPAIATITLMPGSNPVFGLNTLGGAISITTKNGSTSRVSSFKATAGRSGGRPPTSNTAVPPTGWATT